MKGIPNTFLNLERSLSGFLSGESVVYQNIMELFQVMMLEDSYIEVIEVGDDTENAVEDMESEGEVSIPFRLLSRVI